ncbi:hypothetical protein ACPBZR_23905, partial [Escherichia coli]|uniref:hypothetical protein n=1 Tax=Escherichia coli TaxID=562 RepID=UPI003C2CA75E
PAQPGCEIPLRTIPHAGLAARAKGAEPFPSEKVGSPISFSRKRALTGVRPHWAEILTFNKSFREESVS